MSIDGERNIVCATALAAALGLSAGCSLLKPVALKSVASTLAAPGSTVTSHNDPETVRGAIDFALITYESLLAEIPRYEPLLTATCSQYTQYAFGFVYPEAETAQFDDYAKSKPMMDRAFRLADRGRGFCWRALEVKFKGITAQLRSDPALALRRAHKEHVPLLYWSAASLGAAIALGGLDHPELVVEWPLVRAIATRAIALDGSWNRGAAHELMITVEGQGEMMGGSEARARAEFDTAVKIQQGLSPGPYVALAMSVAKTRQDRTEFESLLKQAIAIDPEKDPTNRLVTIIVRQRAQVLLDHVEDLILN